MNKKNNTLMIVGLGELVGIVLELLARIPNICKIFAIDLNEDYGTRKANTVIMGASYVNLYPNIEFRRIDLNNIEETAEKIKKINPKIIYSATTLKSCWAINALPKEVLKKLYKDFCGLGPWIPMHLLLVYKLMQAVEKSGVNSLVINSSFPDNVNAVLGKLD